MAILSARPQAEDLAGWSYDPSIPHPEQDADIPVLLVQGDPVPAGSARITISVAPVSTKVRLRSIDPSTTPYTDLGPAPANMFAAISGTTGAAGTPTPGQWSTDLTTTASHGLTIAGNYETAPGVWTGWTTNWKIIIISAAPVSTNGANPSGFLIYYTNAVDAAGQPAKHTPLSTPPVANWPLLYAQRVAADMEDARTIY